MLAIVFFSTLIFSTGTVSQVQEKSGEVELADPFTIQLDPQEADVFIGYSTTYGKVSPINPKEGTHFYQILGQCLEDNYKEKHLEQIYTLVTYEVARKVHPIDNKDGLYVPQKVGTLRADVYLTARPENRVNFLLNSLE